MQAQQSQRFLKACQLDVRIQNKAWACTPNLSQQQSKPSSSPDVRNREWSLARLLGIVNPEASPDQNCTRQEVSHSTPGHRALRSSLGNYWAQGSKVIPWELHTKPSLQALANPSTNCSFALPGKVRGLPPGNRCGEKSSDYRLAQAGQHLAIGRVVFLSVLRLLLSKTKRREKETWTGSYFFLSFFSFL